MARGMNDPDTGQAPVTGGMGRKELVCMLAGLMALNALAIDAMLPALSAIGSSLRVTAANDVQLVIVAYLLGTGIGSVVHGPLSDRYGRRAVLLWTLLAYIGCALGCAFIAEFSVLLALRFMQGLAGAALGVVAIAIVRDKMAGDQMARMTSTIFMVFMVVPVIAPSVGTLVLLFGGWREIFLLFAVMGLAMSAWVWRRLPETLDPANVTLLDARSIVGAWSSVIRHRLALGYTMAGALTQAGLFGFLTSSSQLFTALFGSPKLFPLAFAAVAATMAASNFLNSRIVERFGARRVSHSAILIFIAMAGVQWAGNLYWTGHMGWLLVPLALNMSMIGLIGSNFSSIAMTPFGHIAGTASSFQTSVRTVISASLGGLIGAQFDGTGVPMAQGFVAAGVAGLLMVLWAERGRLFTRPGTTIVRPTA